MMMIVRMIMVVMLASGLGACCSGGKVKKFDQSTEAWDCVCPDGFVTSTDESGSESCVKKGATTSEVSPTTSSYAYGMLPLSKEFSSDLTSKIGNDIDGHLKTLIERKQGISVRYFQNEPQINYRTVESPDVTIEPVHEDVAKAQLQRILDNHKGLQGVIFGHIMEDWADDSLFIIVRVYRKGDEGYESFGQDKSIPLDKVSQDSVKQQLAKVSESVAKVLVGTQVTNIQQPQPAEDMLTLLDATDIAPSLSTWKGVYKTLYEQKLRVLTLPKYVSEIAKEQGMTEDRLRSELANPKPRRKGKFKPLEKLGFPASCEQDIVTSVPQEPSKGQKTFILCVHSLYKTGQEDFPSRENCERKNSQGKEITYRDAMSEVESLNENRLLTEWRIPTILELFAMADAGYLKQEKMTAYWSSTETDQQQKVWVMKLFFSKNVYFPRLASQSNSKREKAFLIPVRTCEKQGDY